MPWASNPRLRRRLLILAGRHLGPPSAAPAGRPRRVLLVRPDHVGDVLLTSPAVAAVRRALPQAHLTYLVGPWGAEVARHGPEVDRLETVPFPGFSRRPKPNALQPYLLLWHTARRLRRASYDLALILRPDHWWGALLALVAGIPARAGFDTPETRPLLTAARHLDPTEHAVEQALGLVRFAGLSVDGTPDRPVFRLTEREQLAAAQRFASWGLDQRQVVALQPSAGAALKSWPVVRWARLADELAGLGLAVLLVGGPDDGRLLGAIQARMRAPAAALAHGQELGDSAAIYARCQLVVGLDGGAAHLAHAVGTPSVRLYGPASPSVFGPWPPSANQHVLITDQLACVPCGHLEAPPCGARALPACMLALGVDDVLRVVRSQLATD